MTGGAGGPASRLSNLDFLRGLAAVAVLAQHLLEKVDPERFAPVLALAPGIFGVALFFLISGFIIPMSLARGVSAPEFVARRLFRIFPSYFAVLAAVVLLGCVGFAPWQATLRDGGLAGLLANALLVQEYTGHPPLIGVSWTLSLEFVWYAIFLGSALTVGRRGVFALSLAGSVGLIVLAGFSVAIDTRLPLGRLAMLNAALFGYVVFLVRGGEVSSKRLRQVLALFVLAVMTAQGVSFGYFEHPKISLFNSMAGWLAAIAIFMAFQGRHGLVKSRFGVVGCLVGRISYPLYLVHGPLILLWGALIGPVGMLLAVPVLSVSISILLHEFVERPGIALGQRLSGRLPTRVLMGGPR